MHTAISTTRSFNTSPDMLSICSSMACLSVARVVFPLYFRGIVSFCFVSVFGCALFFFMVVCRRRQTRPSFCLAASMELFLLCHSDGQRFSNAQGPTAQRPFVPKKLPFSLPERSREQAELWERDTYCLKRLLPQSHIIQHHGESIDGNEQPCGERIHRRYGQLNPACGGALLIHSATG